MNYTNREVVRRLKQYDMFLNSLNLTTDEVQRERICDQLDKIEKQILLETNSEYEEEYLLLLGEETKLFSEEKNRLKKLISLITNRREYLEERKNNHKQITGSLVELTTFLGEDQLTTFKRNLKIIEKYETNKLRQEELIKEMKSLDIKISNASRNVKANTRLNDMLENKMISLVEKELDELELYSLIKEKDSILKKYDSFNYAMELAKNNLKTAKEMNDSDMVLDCDDMLSQITLEYSKYNEMVNILKLIDIYSKEVNGYNELLEKREEIDDILKCIVDTELYNKINDELNKELNTIKLQKQDIKTYESLKEEREKKNRILYKIEEENNSKEFKEVLEELIKNENKHREEKIRTAKREENRERERKFKEEQKIEAARVKRQKLIEEARLKDQLERTEKLKELQAKTVIKTENKEILKEKEEINNPLKNKSFDEIVSLENDFDTDELFENTKIVPNKIIKEEKTIEDNDDIDKVIDEPVLKWEEPSTIEIPKVEEIPKLEEILKWEEIPAPSVVLDTPVEEKNEFFEIKEDPIMEDKKEADNKKDKESSIYDLLENNQNIIWKTTENKINDTIPVIGNNNLKPEMITGNDNFFPEIGSKEGEMLWKDTL